MIYTPFNHLKQNFKAEKAKRNKLMTSFLYGIFKVLNKTFADLSKESIIKIDQGYLGNVMTGRINISDETFIKICIILGLTREKAEIRLNWINQECLKI